LHILIEEKEGSIWAAALEKSRLEGFEVDPGGEAIRWGSIFWARVKTLDPAIDAAFLDLDGVQTGILYNKDVRLRSPDGKIIKGGAQAIGKTFQAGDMIAVQAKTVHLPGQDDHLTKYESKLPQVSMDITLPGRYLIFCPLMDENHLSARIRAPKLRKQLDAMLNEMMDIKGCILRAAAANTQTEMLIREGKILKAAWEEMQIQLSGTETKIVMQGPDAIQRSLSDHAGKRIERIEVVTMEHFTMVEEWCSIFAPDLMTKIEPIELKDGADDLALFYYRDIMTQIEDLFDPYVLLPGGGSLIIQDTAALTAIDINRGADKNGNAQINLEAAKEIARQIRLRNAGGIIVADFLKMQSKKDEKALIETLQQAIMDDPCTVQIHGMTALGLCEITRKRRTPALQDRLSGVFG
jgi:ribonuclease G